MFEGNGGRRRPPARARHRRGRDPRRAPPPSLSPPSSRGESGSKKRAPGAQLAATRLAPLASMRSCRRSLPSRNSSMRMRDVAPQRPAGLDVEAEDDGLLALAPELEDPLGRWPRSSDARPRRPSPWRERLVELSQVPAASGGRSAILRTEPRLESIAARCCRSACRGRPRRTRRAHPRRTPGRDEPSASAIEADERLSPSGEQERKHDGLTTSSPRDPSTLVVEDRPTRADRRR